MQEPDLVTGDAVVLELQLARSASRAIAYGIDILVQVASLLLVGIAFAVTGIPDDAALVITIITVVQLLTLIGYPAICETLTRGRTLGKAACGLRAVREDGGPIRMRQALVRALAGAFVDFGPFGLWGVIGFLTSLSSAKGKRVGDYLAGTVVVRDRAPETYTPTLSMPPVLASWAAQLDLSNLPDTLALSARQFLGRYEELDPVSRERLGHQLAAEIAQRIGAPAPPHTPSWAYLTAVLAERQARDYARVRPVPPALPVPGAAPPALPSVPTAEPADPPPFTPPR
ncbi:RDD family protein [Saccharomonospora sp. NPDC046836]|uniref:RDD family protein n=1 Tax=Saccharomonospora sp. NPDC046836 TaxID=3156921 RepID=UPI0033D05CC7